MLLFDLLHSALHAAFDCNGIADADLVESTRNEFVSIRTRRELWSDAHSSPIANTQNWIFFFGEKNSVYVSLIIVDSLWRDPLVFPDNAISTTRIKF